MENTGKSSESKQDANDAKNKPLSTDSKAKQSTLLQLGSLALPALLL